MNMQDLFWNSIAPHPTYSTGELISLGDWVRVYLPRLGVWHDGIVCNIYFAGTGLAIQIANNAKGKGIMKMDWHDFAEGQIIHLKSHPSSDAHVQEILERVEGSIGRPFHLIAQNCQHFASHAFNGKAESPYIQALGWAAAIAVAVKVFAR
jgi:hypothetical protein